MITIYSEKETMQRDSAGDYLKQQIQMVSTGLTHEEINREIQANLKSFENIDWLKSKECK